MVDITPAIGSNENSPFRQNLAIQGLTRAFKTITSAIWTFLGSPTSANLAAAVSDETGTGSLVFATNPQFGPNVGFGIAATPTVGLFYAGTITGGADSAGFQLSTAFTAVTANPGSYYNIASVCGVEDGSATIDNLINIRVETMSGGSGNTINNAYGLYVNAQTAGSTSNRSIYVVGGTSEFDGQLIARGTGTNDSAADGDIGEYESSIVPSASAVALTTATAADVTSISLTAGDWDVTGEVWFLANAATTSSFHQGWVSATSATPPSNPGDAVTTAWSWINYSAGQVPALALGTARLSLANTTTVYLGAYALFAVNSLSAYGKISARRVR